MAPAALVVQVVSYPFLDHYRGGRAVIAVSDLAVLALTSRAGGHETWLGYVLVVPGMALHATDALGWSPRAARNLSRRPDRLHAFVVVCLLRYMLRNEIMTRDELLSAAGLYVLMAFVFAYLYALVEQWQPGAFVINAATIPAASRAGGTSSTSASPA